MGAKPFPLCRNAKSNSEILIFLCDFVRLILPLSYRRNIAPQPENNLKETLIFDRLADGAEKLGIMRKFPRLPPPFFSTAARFFACNRFFHTL